MQVLTLKETPFDQVAQQAVAVLKAGGLIIFPTETTYGAGVDATNPQAVAKLLSYKSRREGKPLSIAVTNQAMAQQYVELNDQAKNLYSKFLPGPMTIISLSLGKVAPGVESEFGTLGVRIPDYDLMLDIIGQLGLPITATSANASGGRRPYAIDHIFKYLSAKQKNLIDLVIDAGELPHNEPSTVIDTTLSTPTTLRTGLIKTQSTQVLMSASAAETQKIAGTLGLAHWDKIKETGLVIGLDGELGAGKTVFTKGLAKFLNIKDEITSPTYSYLEEYDYLRHEVTGKMYHLDLWKVENQTELERLEVEKLIGPNRVLVIEWWDKFSTELKEIFKSTQRLNYLIKQQGSNRQIHFIGGKLGRDFLRLPEE